MFTSLKDVRPGTSVRVVAGRNPDWMLHGWFGDVLIPRDQGDQRRHPELFVTASIIRVHPRKYKVEEFLSGESLIRFCERVPAPVETEKE